jgi:hypothetical protein
MHFLLCVALRNSRLRVGREGRKGERGEGGREGGALKNVFSIECVTTHFEDTGHMCPPPPPGLAAGVCPPIEDTEDIL